MKFIIVLSGHKYRSWLPNRASHPFVAILQIWSLKRWQNQSFCGILPSRIQKQTMLVSYRYNYFPFFFLLHNFLNLSCVSIYQLKLFKQLKTRLKNLKVLSSSRKRKALPSNSTDGNFADDEETEGETEVLDVVPCRKKVVPKG